MKVRERATQGWVNMDAGEDPSIHPLYCVFDIRCKSERELKRILNVFGIEVVYWFEYSKEMKDLFQNLHFSRRGDHILTALKTWPGLRWTILYRGSFIDIEAGTVHGVISPVGN